jgi:hypothetical protein
VIQRIHRGRPARRIGRRAAVEASRRDPTGTRTRALYIASVGVLLTGAVILAVGVVGHAWKTVAIAAGAISAREDEFAVPEPVRRDLGRGSGFGNRHRT